MLTFYQLALILILPFIHNNTNVEASGNEQENPDVQNINVVYKKILYDDEKNLNDDKNIKYFQKEIAYFFYKKFCWSILTNYKHMGMEQETNEFRSHFQQIQKDYLVFNERNAIIESKTCDFYKMFVRIIFDKILEKNEDWRQYLRFRTRHFFWLDNQWKTKTEEFLKNMNWQSKENCTEEECENLKEYLTKNSQSYVSNYWSLKWLLGNSLDFKRTVERISDDKKFIEMKRRIFILTGPIGFDRLELTRMNILKIGSSIFEFDRICLKRFLIGMEDSRRYQLRMSISLLMKDFFAFGQLIANTENTSTDEILRELLAQNVAKFKQISDKIEGLLNSIADLNDVNIVQEEAILEQVLCIVLKLFITTDEGFPTIYSKNLIEMTEDDLLNNTNTQLESVEIKRKIILAQFYLELVDYHLEKADTDMQNILKNGTGSIFRLASLVGGTLNLLEIWTKYKDKIRSTDFFTIDFDKRTREYYEILFIDDSSEKSKLLSRIYLNIFLLMNTIEKMLRKNTNFEALLEDWRCILRFKIDFLHINVKPVILSVNYIEIAVKGNIILEFVQKWINKNSSTRQIGKEYEKDFDRKSTKFEEFSELVDKRQLTNEEVDELVENKYRSLAALSSRFQNIHIDQLVKLAEEDKRKMTIDDNEAKTFNFWLLFKKLSSDQDKKILLTRLGIILNDVGIEKLMKKIFELDNFSEITKSGQQQSTGKKLRKEKKKKKTANTQTQPLPKIKEILHSGSGQVQNLADNFSSGPSHSSSIHVEMSGDTTRVSPAESSPAELPILSTEIYQNILTIADLKLVLHASEDLRMDVIDAYLEMLTHGNTHHFGFIPSYVIHYFIKEKIFPPEWLQNTLQQRIVDNVQYWLIPAQLNTNHWVLTIMDVRKSQLHYFDSLRPGSINQKFTIDIFIMFHVLYRHSGHLLISEQFINFNYLPTTISRHDLPIQENGIDCGVFMLMYARDIIEQNSITNAEMHINQSGVKEARKQIYRELMAYQFGIDVDSEVLENLNLLYSSELASAQPEKLGTTLALKESLNEAEQKSTKVSLQCKRERLSSIHEMPEKEQNDAEAIKTLYSDLLITMDYNESTNKHIGAIVALFHFKKLALFMLAEFKRSNIANADEAFRKEIDTKFDEIEKLIKLNYTNTFEQITCIFFKFFMQLRRNKILANNQEWNRYVRFRMRHFYWIDPRWDENANLLLENLIIEQKDYCDSAEILHISQNVVNVRPYSSISHFWTLKWILQNSPEFIEKLKNHKGKQLLILKKRIFDLLGEDGFDKLEMAIPALAFHASIQEMDRISITRYLYGGLEGTKYEIRLALSHLLKLFILFRAQYIDSGGYKDEIALLNIQKMNKIYEQIVEVKLIKLIDEERTLEEEVDELKEALCIMLKFFENNNAEKIPKVCVVKVFSINYKQAMQCTADEFETTVKRKHLLLQSYLYTLIGIHLSAGDKDLENVLKYKEGAVYRLSALIGIDNFLKLWNQYHEKIRDKKYFTNTLTLIRQSFEKFMNTKDDHIRQLNRTKLKIYILMRWLDQTLQTNQIFGNLLLTWHKMFRIALDELIVVPNDVNYIDIECTIKGGKIIEFVSKWIGKTKSEEQIQNEYNPINIESNNLIDHYVNANEVPPLMDGFQLIHVLTLQELANKDKTIKTKTEMGKAKEIDFWQYFKDLYNHPDRIRRIGELLNIYFLKYLHELLGIKFIVSRFNQLGEISMPIIDLKTEEGNTFQKNLHSSGSQQEDEYKKSAKNKLKKKPKMAKSSNDYEEKIEIKENEKKRTNEAKEKSSPIRNIKEVAGTSTKKKRLEGKESTTDVIGKSHKIIEKSGVHKNKKKKEEKEEEQRRRKNLAQFNIEFGKPAKIGTALTRAEITKSAPRGSQITSGISLNEMQATEITKFLGSSRSQSTEKQKPDNQSYRKIVKLNMLKDYTFADLMQFDTLKMHYKELMKDLNNQEIRRFTDIAVFAVEIDQRLNALEIYTKLWTDNNKMNYENVRKEVNSLTINTFKDNNELEETLYNLLKRIEFAMENPINLEKNEEIDNINISKTKKQLHKLRLSWIIQNDPSWHQILGRKNLNQILFALNLEAGKKFNEQIKIWQTIIGQIKLDHELYNERGIKRRGMEIIDFAQYSQQLWFDGQNKKEEELTESLIEEFKFVDVKEIERGNPKKYYLWMRKYMKAKERVKDVVKEWHETAEILFTGSHLLGTMTSRSDMDTIVVTYDAQIYDYNQRAECIIEEMGFDEQMKMQRRRICQNDQLFICKLCKMSRIISVVKIKGSMVLLKAYICEDENYESKSFDECTYKVKLDFLFATLPKKDYLSILKRKDVTSHEIDKILVELYKLHDNRPSFLSLLGLRDNIRILEQFPNDGKNYRIACAALKLWAKHNNIYGPKLGFLKGVHMNLLMAKIYLRYPSASVPFLIEQFFATYIVWPWPMPVQLLPISKLTNDRSGSNPLWYIKKPDAEMPIISPGFIESNKASDIDRYTKSIMRTFMSEGLKQIREIRAGKVKFARNEWHDFMRGQDLAKKYAHYLVVSCLTKISEDSFGDDFCAIAALKLHDYIPTEIGKLMPKEIRWYHIIEIGSRKECVINRDGYSDISKYKCDVWLIGLQLKKDKQIDPEEIINLENKKEMNEAKEKMYNDYFMYKKRFNRQIGEENKNSLTGKLLLLVNYVGVADLHKWNIELRGREAIVKN